LVGAKNLSPGFLLFDFLLLPFDLFLVILGLFSYSAIQLFSYSASLIFSFFSFLWMPDQVRHDYLHHRTKN